MLSVIICKWFFAAYGSSAARLIGDVVVDLHGPNDLILGVADQADVQFIRTA